MGGKGFSPYILSIKFTVTFAVTEIKIRVYVHYLISSRKKNGSYEFVITVVFLFVFKINTYRPYQVPEQPAPQAL